eukprot:g3173.t1
MRRRLRAADCKVERLRSCIEPVQLEDYPFASSVVDSVLIYDRNELIEHVQNDSSLFCNSANSDDKILLLPGNNIVLQIEDELMKAFSDGPGVVVIKNSVAHDVIDQVSNTFSKILKEERESCMEAGDHFSTPGANSRLWNSIEKLAVSDPEGFSKYFANDIVPLVSRSWLGPAYQVSSQLNIVHPGGKAQTPHRDYHLGFMSNPQRELYPAHVHAFSSMLTLQGAICHCDVPINAGPTTFLPHSHKLEDGYLAYELDDFVEYYEENYVQLPLEKGDCIFFNPALFHAAGNNVSKDIHREVNLLQISSPMGRAMETIDRERMAVQLFPFLLENSVKKKLSEEEVKNVIAASTEGYPFPTNLDLDQPVDGLAPISQSDILKKALEEKWSLQRLEMEQIKYKRKRQTN